MTSPLASSSRRAPGIGAHLRAWRQRRRLSQLDLAGDAEISARHLSFVETGRSAPSRDVVMRLAERLDVPLRERNVLLVAAGFAPAFPQRALDDPALASARRAIDGVLRAHMPNPALAVDRQWNLIAANDVVKALLADLPADLLTPPLNVLRLSLHPRGLASRIVNLGQWSAHLMERLQRECEATADVALIRLYEELKSYPAPARPAPVDAGAVVVPFRLRFGDAVLDLISTTMIFGTPLDITLSEIAIETFFPADETTARRLQQLATKSG